jgi:hypothetical protein
MQEITAAHEEQIINMRKDKKTYEDIRLFFKKEYGLTIYDSYIAKIQAGKGKFTATQSLKALDDGPRKYRKGKRKYTRRGIKQEPVVKTTTGNDFALHIHAAFDIHKKDFIPRVMEALANAC